MDSTTMNQINARLNAIERRLRDMQSSIQHLHMRTVAYPERFRREMRFTRTSLRSQMESLSSSMATMQSTVQFLRTATTFGPGVALKSSVAISASRRAESTREPTELELRQRELARKMRAIAET